MSEIEYFAILTAILQPGVDQAAYVTVTRTLRAGPNATRAGLYEYMRGQLPGHLHDAVTLFFSAEPNQGSVS